MPDFNFTISVPVHADMEPFKAEVRAGVEEVMRGVTVPGGVAGGSAAAPIRGRASATFSPSEQAAVDRAMAHSQRTPSGDRSILDSFRDMIEGSGSRGLARSPRGVGASLAMSRTLAPHQGRLPEMVFPGMGTSADDLFGSMSGRISNMQAQLAQARAMRAESAARSYPPGAPFPGAPGSAPSPWPMPPGTPGLPPGGSPLPVPPRTPGAPTPLPIPYPPGRPVPLPPGGTPFPVPLPPGPRHVPPGTPPGSSARRSRRNWIPTNSIRGLVGFLGVTEIGNAAAAIRSGESEAELAESPEEAELARAESVVQATSGLLGSVLTTPLDIFDSQYSPEGRARDARRAVVLRQRRLQQNQARAVRASERRAVAREISSARAEARVSGIRGGVAREVAGNVEAFIDQRNELADEVRDEFDRVNALPAGAERDAAVLSYTQLNNSYDDRVRSAQGIMLARNAAVARQVARSRRSLSRRVTGLQAASEGRFGESEERDFEASLGDAQEDADDSGTGRVQRQVNVLARAARRARQLSVRRSRDVRTGANQVLLGRGPQAAADLSLLDDEERVELGDATSDEDRDSIRRIFSSRRALLGQQFADQRYDLNTSLDSAINQSALRTRGGASNRLAADLDVIVQRSRAEALDLERQGLDDEAAKRRRLGGLQVREFRADYFRSINFEEVSGGRIAAGRGNPFADVERRFRDAEKAAGERGAGESSGGMSPEQANEMIGLLREIRDRHFTARHR